MREQAPGRDPARAALRATSDGAPTDCPCVLDDWRDYLPALRARGVSVTEELAKVAHLLSWYQRNDAIAGRMSIHVSKVKVLVHDLLVLFEVDHRDAAALMTRHAVEKWRADQNHRSAARRTHPPAAKPRRPGAAADDGKGRGPTPNA